MDKVITSDIFVSYSQCPRKAYLLLCTNEKGIPNEYINILQQRKIANQERYINTLKQKDSNVQSYSFDNLKSGSDFLTNATLKVNEFEAECGFLTKMNESSAFGDCSYEPTIFAGTYTITKEHKLELLFVGYVLKQIQNKLPAFGRIIGMGDESHKVKLENVTKTIVYLLEPLQEWTMASSPKPPLLILNRHCTYCQFQRTCKDQAEKEDNLSLLDAISTPKVIRKYERKGIFTVKQLSYLFRPRKRKKRAKSTVTAHKPELQALAIRTGKIYLQELPELSRKPVELFLDIEGIPDQGTYYLIGLLVCEDDICTYHSFWADTLQDESHIWQQFLEKINQYPDAPIYHYGSYEPKAINELAKRYETTSEDIKNRLININKHIYGMVYFPVRSNGLKAIGGFIGASWTSSNASGLQSLVWRHYWEETNDTKYQDILVTYNEEDCQALKLLKDKIGRIGVSVDVMTEVELADQPKMHTTEIGDQVYNQFKAIIKSASIVYERNKISFRQLEEKKDKENNKERYRIAARELHKKLMNSKRKVTKVVQVSQMSTCPKCKDEFLQPSNRVSKRVIIDLTSTRYGVKKTITEYMGTQGYCQKCYKYYPPSDISRSIKNQLYGHGFRAWVIYNRVALHMPYESIQESLMEYFKEKIAVTTVPLFIKRGADYYAETQKIIIQRILNSPVIHADETTIIIKSSNWYVWVFTNGEYVVFILKETREATFVYEFLANYQGVLVSDFYSGYDSIPCRQQKCWVHLIRDINNDLRETPFDEEFEAFVMKVQNLIVPIIDAVQEHGLKKRRLNKFKSNVHKFYREVIIDKRYKSELVIKYQKRFIRYQESLFTFLEEDGIPWHNLAAERAIRHVAIQREMSTSLSKTVTPDYLLLLGIRQTCRFQGKSFFKFLFSGEKDIDQFEAHKRSRNK
jgi:predicted RecB family nuclease